MTMPFKKTGYPQGIYEQSSTCKCMLGEFRITRDGRKWRYGHAGGSDLCPGKMGLATALSAYVVKEVIVTAVAIGKRTLDLTITTGTAIAENELRGGYFATQVGTGAGQNILITGNTAMASDGTEIQVSLDDPIKVALDTTTYFNLSRSMWWAVNESSTGEAPACGVAPIAVTTLYYYWAQTGGMANVLQEGTDNLGCNMTVSTATEGAVVSVVSTAIDADLPLVGVNYGIQGETGEYTPVFLTID